MLTTREVAERLDALQSSVRIWLRKGRFPGAIQEDTFRGPVWLVPESDVESFKKLEAGRPPKTETTGTAKKASKKGGKK